MSMNPISQSWNVWIVTRRRLTPSNCLLHVLFIFGSIWTSDTGNQNKYGDFRTDLMFKILLLSHPQTKGWNGNVYHSDGDFVFKKQINNNHAMLELLLYQKISLPVPHLNL